MRVLLCSWLLNFTKFGGHKSQTKTKMKSNILADDGHYPFLIILLLF